MVGVPLHDYDVYNCRKTCGDTETSLKMMPKILDFASKCLPAEIMSTTQVEASSIWFIYSMLKLGTHSHQYHRFIDRSIDSLILFSLNYLYCIMLIATLCVVYFLDHEASYLLFLLWMKLCRDKWDAFVIKINENFCWIYILY